MPVQRRTMARAMLLVVLGAWPAMATPYMPLSDDTVLERLPVALGASPSELRRLRAHAAAQPDELAPALTLAERYFAIGRTSQDPRFIGYARAALARWWDEPAPPSAVLTLRAATRQNRHDFTGALADLDRALAADPGDPRALAGKAGVLMTQGRPEAALPLCSRLARHAAGIAGAVCEAAALGRLGQAQAGYALLATTLVRSDALPPELEAWARLELAELAILTGQPETAEHHLREALRLQPQDAYAAIALADLLLDRERPEAALAVIADDPRNDGKLLRATIALRRLDDPSWRAQAAVLADRFGAARARGDTLHRREEARFLLELADAPDEALQMAEVNWQAQREPADARLLLDAAVAAGKPKAAAPVTSWLDATGFADLRLEPWLARLLGGGA